MRPVGSTLTSPRSGEPDGPAGDEPAVEGAQDLVDLARGARQPGHHLGGGEPQNRCDVGVVGEPSRRRPGPSRGLLQLADQCAGPCLGVVDAARSSVPSSASPSACRRPGTVVLAAEQLPGPQDRQHQVEFGLARRRLAQHVQPVADLHVLDLAQPAVDVQQHVVERVVVGALGEAEVVVELRGPHQRPDLLADGGQLARVQRGDVRVLVEQLLESRDVAVGFGARHRRDEVVDERGVRAPLRLGALAGVVDEERVDQRQVAERGVGAARRGHAQRLAGQPLQVAVLAEVHDGVGAEPVVQPVVGGQVVVARRQVRVVVDGDRVLAESARRLHHQHDVARLQCGDDDLAVGVACCGRRTARPAPGPSAPRRPRSARRAASRTRRDSPWRTTGSGCPPAGLR